GRARAAAHPAHDQFGLHRVQPGAHGIQPMCIPPPPPPPPGLGGAGVDVWPGPGAIGPTCVPTA
ncbi:MAG TPA: hypothetical protein VIH64_00650, partial [Streptosporangiaceae bacterium]